eukprot:scaffold493_cov131-Skeletonema_dohrnii-CCMP3373.AAC.2
MEEKRRRAPTIVEVREEMEMEELVPPPGFFTAGLMMMSGRFKSCAESMVETFQNDFMAGDMREGDCTYLPGPGISRSEKSFVKQSCIKGEPTTDSDVTNR